MKQLILDMAEHYGIDKKIIARAFKEGFMKGLDIEKSRDILDIAFADMNNILDTK